MRSHTAYLWFNTTKRQEIINISAKVKAEVEKSEIEDGFCLVSAMHITAAVWVNDEEAGLKDDLLEWVNRLAPIREDYRHHRTGEDNGDAHLKRSLLHHQAVLPITKGELDLGPWEEIFYLEFDGRRKKRLIIKIIGE